MIGGRPVAARGHMPFPGFRTQKQVRLDELRRVERALAARERALAEPKRTACPYCGSRFEHGCNHFAAGYGG